MSASIKTLVSGVKGRLKGLVERGGRDEALISFLNVPVTNAYKEIQRRRWETENVSEGQQWSLLKDARYKKWKSVTYGSDPTTGRPLLVASGRLKGSIIGTSREFKKVATRKGLTITTSVPYAAGVDQLRSFTTYSRETREGLRKMVRDFMFFNRLGVFRK